MELYSSIGFIVLIFTITANIFLAFLVLKSNTRGTINKIFCLLTVLMCIWLGMNYLSVLPSFINSSLSLIRFSLFFATPLNGLFFLFAHTLPKGNIHLSRNKLLLGGTVLFFVMALTISPYTFTGVDIQNGLPSPIPGPGLAVFGLVAVCLNIYTVFLLIKKTRNSSGEQKKQLALVTVGTLAMFGLIVLTIFIPAAVFKVNYFVPFLPLYTLIFLSTTAYAIVQHGLFNAKVIAAKALIVILLIVLFAKIFVSVSFTEQIVDSIILLVTLIVGIMLVRSVSREVAQRTRLELISKQLEHTNRKLKSANVKLKELDRLKTEFIFIASHQLRTPLTATKWALEFFLQGQEGKITPKQRESLSELAGMNKRLIGLVNELLNISRIDEGRLKIEPKPTDIVAMVKEILTEYMPIARKNELIVEEHYDKLPLINVDPAVISRSISNILSNGIKYNREGKHLWVEVRKNKEHAYITVKDEGIGIPKKEQAHLFEKFYRASNAAASNTEGTGLGLYIAKTALEMSGGGIEFESKEGIGTTFKIFLPLKGSKARQGEKSLA